MQKIWLITGISSGLGAALADRVLAEGDFVIGTFRTAEQAEKFSEKWAGHALGLVLDITKKGQIRPVFQQIRSRFGRLDVLVNNAGFGFTGAVEEASDRETREVFEANFFGALAVTWAALPFFRHQKNGQIFQISSHGGLKAMAGFGIYNASKFALEGFSEALAAEVAPLGVRLTIVEPGPFRTGFAGVALREATIKIDDYEQTAGLFRGRLRGVNGLQEGDPAKAAAAIFSLSKHENPPLRLPLGKTALVTIGAKIASVQKDLDDWREVAAAAVF